MYLRNCHLSRYCLPCKCVRLIAFGLLIVHVGCGSAPAQSRTATRSAAKADITLAADAKDIGQDWVRIKYDAKGEPIAMQTAIVRYTAAKASGKRGAPASVDLIGAVHIGDTA